MTKIRLTIVSDLHGNLPPEQPPGDILIVAGDLTGRDTEEEYFKVFDWIHAQPFTSKILVAGNHDVKIMESGYPGPLHHEFNYLCNTGLECFGLKIWGCPQSLWFKQINPECAAFTGSEEELKYAYDKIPDDTDIIISHGPAKGLLDGCARGRVGSQALLDTLDRVKPLLLVSAHIHEESGNQVLYKHAGPNTLCVNGSYVNNKYKPTGKLVHLEIDGKIISRID